MRRKIEKNKEYIFGNIGLLAFHVVPIEKLKWFPIHFSLETPKSQKYNKTHVEKTRCHLE